MWNDLNVISGGFALGGKTGAAQEVYTSQISGTAQVGKCSREEGKVVISFSEFEMEHVTCLHEDALVITVDIDGCDVK